MFKNFCLVHQCSVLTFQMKLNFSFIQGKVSIFYDIHILIIRKVCFQRKASTIIPSTLIVLIPRKTSLFPYYTQALNNLIEENSVLVESRNSSARGRHFFLCPEWRMGLTRYVYMRDLLLSGTLYHIWTLQEFFDKNIM